jgi:hypothetical protein
MTSLLNPNDIEIKNKLINNINRCIENANIYYSFNKKNLISIVNNYNEKHLKLNINKDNFLEYIILLIQNKVFDRLSNDYNQVNLLNIESINIFNKYLLSITEINEPLLNLIQHIYNRWQYNDNKIDIDLIYYNIYNLKKSNEIQMNDIKELKKSNEIQIEDIKELKETIKYLENTNIIMIFLLISLFKIIITLYYNGVNNK